MSSLPATAELPHRSKNKPIRPSSEMADTGIPWIGLAPQSWPVKRLRWTVESARNGIWGSEPDGENDIPCVRVADFDRVSFRVSENVPTIRSVTPSERHGRVLSKGDLLLEKSGGGELQPVGAVAIYDSDHPAVCSNFLARLVPASDSDSRFLSYLHAHLYSARVNVRSIKQTTGIQNLDAYSYFCEQVPVPPLDEQKAIAAFLDRETSKIDELIAKKEQLITLLAVKREARIAAAVIDTTRSDSTIPIKRLLTFTTSGSRGWAEFYSDEGDLFIQSGNLNRRLGLDLTTVQRIRPPEGAEARRTMIKRHDILVCITGAYTGNVGVVDFDPPRAYINQHIAMLRVRRTHAVPRFLAYLLASSYGQEHFKASQYGGTKQGLGFDDILSISIPLPKLDEQLRIVHELDSEIASIERTVAKTEDFIRKLQEYRASIISAAVTGQIDVRGYRAEAS
jgi:type I restriction enzyme, S subunit